MIYTVTCNPSLDYVLYLQQLQPTGIHRSEREELTYGGKGINVSAVLTRLGEATTALGFVAGAMGEQLCRLLTADGIASDFTRLPTGDTRINVKLRHGDECDINAGGPSVTAADLQRLLTRLQTLMAGDALVLAGSLPSGMSDDAYAQLLASVVGRDVLTVVDTVGDALRKTLPFHPFLIKPNTEELGALFGKTLQTDEDVLTHARLLQAEGARNVLVSRGGDGAMLLDENGVCHTMRAPHGVVRNTVGSGDSMVAGFLAAWLRSGDYDQALRMGIACGSATAFSETLATREQIEQVLSQLTV